ncbi:MAG: glutathione S-transferase family protein [Erythrobacter sp.]|nr:glutathione S-transferase family protein [Erythrobacter sp.]
MQIYGFPISPFVRKVMVACAEKGLAAEVIPVNPGQPPEDFLAASPYRKIPALADSDFTLADSTAIVTYLEALHPAPALLPADPRARAMAVWFEEVADTILTTEGGPMLFNRFVAPKFLGIEGDEAKAVEAEEKLATRLGYLDQQAATGEWLGDSFTIGDIAVASVFRSLAYAGWELDAAAYPSLAAWYGRVCARPGWQAAAAQEAAVMGG